MASQLVQVEGVAVGNGYGCMWVHYVCVEALPHKIKYEACGKDCLMLYYRIGRAPCTLFSYRITRARRCFKSFIELSSLNLQTYVFKNSSLTSVTQITALT